jgi:hypothetical protein
MRLSAFAAAVALLLPVHATAQPEPDPAQILLGALERARENVPAGVEEYVMTLTLGPARAELYAHRDADGWTIDEEDDAPLADLFQGMAIWPRLAASVPPGATAADVDAAYPRLRYLGTDTVEGRTAHVVMAHVPDLTLETMPLSGAANVSIDAETRQVLRIAISTDIDAGEGGVMANGGHVDMTITFGGYEAVGGVTLPRRWMMHVRMRTGLTDEQLAAERGQMASMLDQAGQLGSGTSAGALQTRMLIEMFIAMLDGKPMEVAGVLDDVRVNAGPPEWFSGQDY